MSKITGKRFGFFKVILLAILLAGSMDISAAFLDSFIGHRISPVIVLQYIASAIFGQTAFTMGWFGGLAGLFFHYLIVAIWTLLFFLLYPKLKITSRYKSVAGLIYGIFIWTVMNFLVVPLSNTQKFPLTLSHAFLGALYVMFCVGLPVSLMYHRYKSKNL